MTTAWRAVPVARCRCARLLSPLCFAGRVPVRRLAFVDCSRPQNSRAGAKGLSLCLRADDDGGLCRDATGGTEASIAASLTLESASPDAGSQAPCLIERIAADEIDSVIYARSRPCVVVLLLRHDRFLRQGIPWRNLQDAVQAEAASAHCAKDAPEDVEQAEQSSGVPQAACFLLRFADAKVAEAWTVALRRCLRPLQGGRERAQNEAGVGGLAALVMSDMRAARLLPSPPPHPHHSHTCALPLRQTLRGQVTHATCGKTNSGLACSRAEQHTRHPNDGSRRRNSTLRHA